MELLLNLEWLRDPLRLTILYALSAVAMGLPLVWTFDPTGERAVFEGLVLGALTLMVPTGIYLALPPRWGMALFSAESLAIWIFGINEFTPPRILTVFILWSLVELPMYGFELLGLLEPKSKPLPRPRLSTLFLAWLTLAGGAYVACYFYDSAPNTAVYSTWEWALASLYLPIPPLIVLRHVLRRILRLGDGATKPASAAG